MGKSFYKKSLRLEDTEKEYNRYTKAGYTVKVLPSRERGLNQPNYRDLQLTPPATLREQLKAAKILRQK